MAHPPSDKDIPEDTPRIPGLFRPTLRLVHSRPEEIERPDDGLRRLLRTSPGQNPGDREDDPGPSAA